MVDWVAGSWRPLVLGLALGVLIGSSASMGYVMMAGDPGILRGAPDITDPGQQLPGLEDEREGDQDRQDRGDDLAAMDEDDGGDETDREERENGADEEAPVSAEEVRLTQPVAGSLQLVTPFDWIYDEDEGMWVFHPGVVLGASPDSDVRAPMGGQIASLAPGQDGVLVAVDHGGTLVTRLVLAEAEVDVGDEVESGQRLGRLGSSGRLYLEVRLADQAVDPWSLMAQE